MYQALNLTFDNEIFDFCGIEVVAHQYFDSVPSDTNEDRQKILFKVEELAKKLK